MSNPVPQFRSRIPRFAEVAVERARLTVVPRRRTRAAKVPFVALVTIVLLGGVVGLLLFNTSMQQASFASTALEGQADTLAARQQSLQMELDRLRNPQRIAAKAQALGMVQAGPPTFLGLDGTVTGVGGTGDPTEPFRIWPTIHKPAVLTPQPHVVTVPPPEGTLPTGSTGISGDTGDGKPANGAASGKNHQNQQSHQPQNQNQR
jgi:cell division protein FtsB